MFLLGLGAPPPTRAQVPPDSWLAAATTTIPGNDGKAWVCVAWSSSQPEVLAGRVLAIYAKPGGFADPGTWERVGTVRPGTMPASEAVAEGAALGDDPVALGSAIDALSGRSESAQAATPAAKLAWLVGAARADAALFASLDLLATRYHAVRLVLGRAWATRRPLGATVLEVRDVDPALGDDRFVAARFALVCGSPVPLRPPGAPEIVESASTADTLRVGLVWGVPDDLRQRRPLLAGFDVWRIPAAAARQAGLDARAPRLAELHSLGTRLNEHPVVPAVLPTLVEAAAAAKDPSRAFWTDAGPANPAWTDGDEFAWFIVARDLTGTEGEPSLAGFGWVCDRIPARIPRDLTAANAFRSVEDNPRRQVIELRWKADDAPEHRPRRFEVFRGSGELPPVASTNEPPAAWKIAEVPAPDSGEATWTDLGLDPGLDPTLYGRGFWYAVRSVRETRCGPVASALCPPVCVNVRRFDAPDAPTGELGIQCPRVVVLPPNPNFDSEPLEAPDTATRQYRVAVHRRDPGVAWVEILVSPAVEGHAPLVSPQLRFGDQQDEVSFDFGLPRSDGAEPVQLVQVIAGAYSGAVSEPVVYELPGTPVARERRIARSEAATVAVAEARPDDPFFAGIVTGPFPLAGVQRDDNLVFSARSPTSAGELIIQAAKPGTRPEDVWRWVSTVRVVPLNAAVGPFLQFADPAIPADSDWPHEVTYRSWIVTPARLGTPFPCAHLARPSGSAAIIPIKVRMSLPVRTQAWRMYRQVDDAPLTLFAEGAGAIPTAGTGARVEATDDAMPVGAARICYFGQVADEHGNWSPLGPLGCEDVLPAVLPVPLLAAPESEGDAANPVMRLRWFCAPDGLSRFRIILKPVGGTAPSQGVSPWTAKSPALAVAHSKPVRWFSTAVETRALAGLTVSSTYDTGPIGDSPPGRALGPGPDFTMDLDVAAEVTYEVQVAAVDARGNLGPASGLQRFTWRVPRPVVDRDVPWPQRPLPPVQSSHPLVSAVLLYTNSVFWPANSNAAPVGVRIGRIELGQRELVNDVLGLTPGERGGWLLRTFATRAAASAGKGLESFLFSDTNSLPPRDSFRPLNVVMYRRQLTNAEFPEVSGDVVQVTPQLRQLAAVRLADGSGYECLDPALALTLNLALPNGAVDLGRSSSVDIHLLDQHPVARGARYRYWLVHFDENGEPDQTLPAGDVEVPL